MCTSLVRGVILLELVSFQSQGRYVLAILQDACARLQRNTYSESYSSIHTPSTCEDGVCVGLRWSDRNRVAVVGAFTNFGPPTWYPVSCVEADLRLKAQESGAYNQDPCTSLCIEAFGKSYSTQEVFCRASGFCNGIGWADDTHSYITLEKEVGFEISCDDARNALTSRLVQPARTPADAPESAIIIKKAERRKFLTEGPRRPVGTVPTLVESHRESLRRYLLALWKRTSLEQRRVILRTIRDYLIRAQLDGTNSFPKDQRFLTVIAPFSDAMNLLGLCGLVDGGAYLIVNKAAMQSSLCKRLPERIDRFFQSRPDIGKVYITKIEQLK
jgi:hypothetical protein